MHSEENKAAKFAENIKVPKFSYYECSNGKEYFITDETVRSLWGGKYTVVVCRRCCNVPVCHVVKEV